MYGQGPYAPQFGQSPNRPPRPPLMQQQRPSVSPHAVAQPVVQQAHALSQVDSAYYSASMAQSSSSTSMPTTGQNSTTVIHPFLSAQQGAQCAQYFLPLPPPPPPSQNQNLYRPLPPPPPMLPPSPPLPPESVQNTVTHDTNRESDPNDASVEGGLSSMPSDAVDVSPPRPTNEITLRNMEILCQYISQNGPAFEDMARQKESGNSAFRFLFGGEPGSEAAAEREYYLWMKNKLGSGQSKSNFLVKDKHDENGASVELNREASYPVTDSDMEMEDDILQPSEETIVHDQVSGPKHEFVSGMDDTEKNDQNNVLHTSTIYTGPAMNLGGDDGGRSNQNIGTKAQTEEPFRMLKDYSSDESSEFDALEPLSPLQLHEPKDLDTSVAPKISADELIPGPSLLDKKSDIAVGNNVRTDESKQSDYHDLEERDQRECSKSSVSAKVDEFGRLIRESASESESDDSRQYRWRGRRGRSRSSSRSPPKRRRRSPWRRKERRSLSRSWSPKRRRSRSPLRCPIESGSQRNSRGRHQMGECFDFLKGRCYRGASCKYLHNDPDKYSQSQQHRTKYHASQTRTTSRDYDHSEENKVSIKQSSLDEIQNDKIKDVDLKAIDGSTHRVEASSSCLPNSVSHTENISDSFNSNLQKDKQPEDVQISAVSPCKKDLSTSISSAFNYPKHVSQLQQPLHLPLPPPPPPPPLPSLHAASIPHIPQPIQYYSSEHQQTQFHPPQHLPWGNFPPQRPPQFQQGGLPVRFDLLMQSSLNTKPADLPFHPQAGNLQASYNISMQGSHQPVAGEPSSSGFQNPPYLQQQQQQQQPYGFYQAAGSQISDLHKNNPSHVSDTGSRITAHYNPYASTFDQPLGSKFSSDVFNQGNKTSGSEYDPLFDSIEPLKIQTVEEDRAADNSDIMLRLSKVKGKKKVVVGGDSAATSSETDEFGETAHPEVIVVEGGSQSNLNNSAEGSGGDVEINQGKSKKNKDSSRSMKLFRVALASFVKDMLKPSWRQGNMSKEVFKTIVKKTVEKVSGAMKGHRVPNCKANIDQYINRSQRKLTALVEGYVNKFAK